MAGEKDLKTFHRWVYEAHVASRAWREESWRDCEMYDGGRAQWSDQEWEDFRAAGFDPLTINRTFPVVNLLLGTQAQNKFQIVAKGRTQRDGEISQVMSEGIQFLMDQCGGEFLISEAFADQVIAGVGCLVVTLNSDPRQEKIRVARRDWREVYWDPYSSPWFTPERCRYVFHHPWTDLSELQAMFPERARELEEQFNEMTSASRWDGWYRDEATLVEDERQVLPGYEWADRRRRRVRPVNLWYTVFERGWYAILADGQVLELDRLPAMEQYEVIRQAVEVVQASVRKMRTATFLGDVLLHEGPTPFGHDQYPFVPFVGYVDRWGFPYGVPRQIRSQDIEVNKRRSMALALLRARQVIMEEDAVGGGQDVLQRTYEEVNKLDGFIILRAGALREGKFQIREQGQLAPSQVALLEQSEREINETSGANAERQGLQTNAVSGRAIQARQAQGATMTASLFDNLRRSLQILGELCVSAIQTFWTEEKVLRITDRLTGAEKFVSLNQRVVGADGTIEVRNNVTQGRYDIVVSEAPSTDTIREQNLNLIIEWVKKSPPEIIPYLMNMALEMSNLPNKEQLLARIRPILGISPDDEDITPEEAKERALRELEAHQALQQHQAELEEASAQLELEHKRLENEKLRREIGEIEARGRVDRARQVAELVARERRIKGIDPSSLARFQRGFNRDTTRTVT